MNKSKKIFIGFLSFLPLLVTIGFFIYFLSFISTIPFQDLNQNNEEPPAWLLTHIFSFVAMAILLAFVHLGLLIYFIIHAINNPRVKNDERIIWILVFIFVSTVGFPIYWGIRIWPDEKPESNFVKM